MKILKKKNSIYHYAAGFTLVELIVAVVISSIVLTILMSFITTSMNEITYSNKQTEVLDSINTFSTAMNNYKGSFEVTTMIIDKTGSGSDVIMLSNEEENEGILIGIVGKDTLALEATELNFNTIYEKHLAVRELTQADIVTLKATPESAYDLNFNEDKLFYELVMKDFQIGLYNNGAIIDADLDILINYKQGVDGENWENITNDWVYSINMNF